MSKEKIKVYLYTRVSTSMQIDGYSLDAQKSRMKAFCEFNDYEIIGEYEDAGKSGKSIEGRVAFKRMMEEIKTGKDNVSFVLVFKLSRFGRNAADVLNSLQMMQDFGVNLICVEDGIDSSKEAGRLMISVLSAVAEIERENIRVQTMEGRMQKAREGRWNGGFPPYGYSLVDGELIINEEEAVAIRTIFDQYVNTDMGSNGIAKYLENHGIHKITRQNGTNPLFDASLIRRIIQNPVYAGKIAYGRRRTEKVHGTRNDYHQVYKDDYLLVDGLHEALVSEEVWELAQVKVIAQAKKYEKVNSPKGERIHLLSGILKCPICGAGMYGNKSIKHKKDGTRYSDYFYYGCKHRNMTRGHKCDYRKQISEEKLDGAVTEVLYKLVSNKKFAGMMRKKIGMEVDTTTLDQEIASYEKTLRQCYSNKDAILSDLDNIDYDDKHYQRRKSDLENRLSKVYDKIEETEDALIEAKAKKRSILAEKVSGDNIYKALIFFEKTNDKMNDAERRDFFTQIIEKVEIHEEEQQNGQWLKSITFKLPIIPHDMEMSLDKGNHVDTGGHYKISSIYFDNCDDKALREKVDGINKREKFRIRYYNNDFSFITLEKKMKIDNLCAKFDARITKEELDKILIGDIEWMRHSDNELIKEFYAKLRYQRLKPRSLVSYLREPYIYKAGNVRVTFDSEIRTTLFKEVTDPSNAIDISATDIPTYMLVEVKYDAFLPDVIKDIVQLNGRQQAFSKYGISRRFG